MQIKSYLDFYQLLESDTSSKEDRRAFGLSHRQLKEQPLEQLMAWLGVHEEGLKRPLYSDTFASYLYGMTFVLVLIAFVVGVFSGMALLHYNGKEPVNVVYFMGIVIFLPLLTMFFALLSMLKAHQNQSVLVHISPAYWMEKLCALLPKHLQYDKTNLKISPLLANWMVIKRSQFIALFFSLGLVLSLLFVIVTKDIAFAWSTTLQMTPEAFHAFVKCIALPWEWCCPDTVPSMALIEQSHYFRLGDSLSQEMIGNASDLGQWWQFLLIATLFYALFLRLLLYGISVWGLGRSIEKSLLSLEGVSRLLEDMNEPIISTHAVEKVEKYEISQEGNLEVIEKVENHYEIIQGWAMSQKQLMLINDSMSLSASTLYEVGGTNSLQEDSIIIAKSHGEVLLYVKAWEPPTMDFIDYLEELIEEVTQVIVLPIGTEANGYIPVAKAIKVWERKLALFDNPKVSLKVSEVEKV